MQEKRPCQGGVFSMYVRAGVYTGFCDFITEDSSLYGYTQQKWKSFIDNTFVVPYIQKGHTL